MGLLNLDTEDLFQIVFHNRNKEYGSYQIRKKYNRTLLVSTVIGVVLSVTAFLIPLVIYISDAASRLADDDFYYEVDYMPIDPPSTEEINDLARALSKPPETPEQEPVVSDTVRQVDKELQTPEEKEQDTEADTAGQGGGVKDGTGTGDLTGIATVIDVYPRFPGGDEARLAFLKRAIRYPQAAIQTGIQGVVVVVFIIETDGTISNIKIEKGIGSGCDEESVRVVKMMPRWEPGKRQGRAVRVMVRMPVVFRIPPRST